MIVTDCHCCVIEESWSDIAVIAWSGYLNVGRGLVRVDTTRTKSTSPDPLMLYQSLDAQLHPDEISLIEDYDPNKEAVVCIVDTGGRHACKASHMDLTPPAAYATRPGGLVNEVNDII